MNDEKIVVSGFDLGHDLIEILSKASTVQMMDDAVYVFNQGYAVLRRQLEDKDKICIWCEGL